MPFEGNFCPKRLARAKQSAMLSNWSTWIFHYSLIYCLTKSHSLSEPCCLEASRHAQLVSGVENWPIWSWAVYYSTWLGKRSWIIKSQSVFELRSMTYTSSSFRKLKSQVAPGIFILAVGTDIYIPTLFSTIFFFKSWRQRHLFPVSLTLLKQTIEELRSKLTQQETNMPPDGNLKT